MKKASKRTLARSGKGTKHNFARFAKIRLHIVTLDFLIRKGDTLPFMAGFLWKV